MNKYYLGENKDISLYPRIAKVTRVYDDILLSTSSVRYTYGTVEIEWIDGFGDVETPIKACFPYINTLYGSGLICLPSVGDLVVCLQRKNGFPLVITWFPDRYEFCTKLYTTLESSLQDSNSLLEVIGPIRPLSSGEFLLKSKAQAEIYLDRHGSVRTYTQNINNFDAISLDGVSDFRVRSVNNLATESINGYIYNNNTVNDVPEMYNNIPLKSRHRILDTLLTTEELSVVSGQDTYIVSKTPLKSIVSLICGDVSYLLNVDYKINDDLDGFTFTTTNKPVSGILTIVYYYEQEYYKMHVDSLGNLKIDTKSLNMGIKSKSDISYQASILIGKDGSILINGNSLEQIINNNVSSLVNSFFVDFQQNIKFDYVTVENITVNMTYEDNDEDSLEVDTNIVELTSVYGKYAGVENIEFIIGIDVKLNSTKTGLQFITDKIPDDESDLTIEYKKKSSKAEIKMEVGNIKLKSLSGSYVSIDNTGVYIQAGEDQEINLAGSDVSGTKSLLYAKNGLTEITDINNIGVCTKVRGA